MPALRPVAPFLATVLAWAALPADAEAGWRARAKALEAQATEVQADTVQPDTLQPEQEAPAEVTGLLHFHGGVLDGEPVAAVLVEDGLAVEGRPALVLSQDQLTSAVEAGSLDQSQIRWLKPSAGQLPPNPHATTDFTAYTLQPGELKVGLLSVGVGVLPNVQVTTMPLVYYAGLPNISAKINAIQVGPLNLAVQGSRYWLRQESFRSAYTGVGAIASLRVVKAWSVHGGFNYAGLSAKGIPDVCALSSLLTETCDDWNVGDPQPVSSSGSAFGIEGNDIYGEVLWVRAATDVRFNRRDSIILQAASVPFARLQVNEQIELPDIAQLDEVLAFDGRVPLTTMYMLSAAWQMAWKNVHLRVGVGTSSLPLAWLTQTTELSVRFGGKDRVERGRQYRAWRRNRRDLARGVDEEQGTDGLAGLN